MKLILKVLFGLAVVGSIIFLVHVSNVMAIPQASEDNPNETITVINGVVTINGHLDKAGKAEAHALYEQRMIEIARQRDEDTARKHQLDCIKEFAKVEALREEASRNELQALMLSGAGQNINIAEGGKAEAYSVSEANASVAGGSSGVVPNTTVNNTLVNLSENTNTVKSTNTNKQ
jgi:hypothetical protein